MAFTSIDNPELYFQTKLYTGNGTDDTAITLDGDENMQPDWVWIKERDDANAHYIFDSVRGIDKQLQSNSTAAEYDYSGDANRSLKSFNSDGFTLGTGAGVNGNGELFVAWCWKESATAGFDIVTYTGNQTARTISHNLGAVPKMMIVKNRGTTGNWGVYHVGLGTANKRLELDGTAAADTGTSVWNDTDPTSSVFSVGDNDRITNGNGMTYVAYLFAEKQGYSKFGSYTGNGQDTPNGVFIYLGFTPAFILIKATDDNSWVIVDNKRPADSNPVDDSLAADSTAAETTGDSNTTFDFLSNGFRTNGNSGNNNSSGQEYIFMAFAEQPFVSSTGVPATAR